VKTLIAFGILLLVGFLGAVKLFNRLENSSPFSYLFYSGTIFIFFGLVIGENGFNLISGEIIHHLRPLIHFSLGWVGFIFGFQLEIKFLKRIAWTWYISLLATYFAAFSAVFFLSYLGVRFFSGGYIEDLHVAVGFSLVLAIVIPESSIAFVVWSSKFFKRHIAQIRLCSFISAADNFFPIFFTGLLFSLYRYIPASHTIAAIPVERFLYSFGIQLFIGILSGGIIHFLLKRVQDKLEISAVFLGVIFFVSGLAFMFDFSPLFVCMITGAMFSNMTRGHSYFLKIVNPTEKPIYLIFLVYLAIQRAILTMDLVLLAITLLAGKFFFKGLALKALSKFKPLRIDLSPYFSYILLPLGSVAAAIILDLFIAFPDENTRKIIGIFIFSQVFLELFAPAGIKIAQKRLTDEKEK
jgi:hypothetical protein